MRAWFVHVSPCLSFPFLILQTNASWPIEYPFSRSPVMRNTRPIPVSRVFCNSAEGEMQSRKGTLASIIGIVIQNGVPSPIVRVTFCRARWHNSRGDLNRSEINEAGSREKSFLARRMRGASLVEKGSELSTFE